MSTQNIILIVVGVAALIGGWFVWNAISNPDDAASNVSATANEVASMSTEDVLANLGTAATTPIEFPDLSGVSDIDEMHEQFFVGVVNQSPEWSSQLRLFGDSPDPMGGLLDDISIESQVEGLAHVKAGLEKLRSFDYDSQTQDQKLTTDIMDWFFENQIRGEEFMHHGYLIHQLFSVPNNFFTFMTGQHQVNTKVDALNYISRLNAVETKFDQLIANLQHQESLGIVAPKFILETVLTQLGAGGDPTQSIFYTSFEGKLDGLNLTDVEKEALLTATADAIANSVQPAYQRLRAAVEHNVTLATDDAGVWHLPNGDEYYAQMLRQHTTTDLTAEEIHNIGLAEVERIQGEMRQVLADLGYDTEDPVYGNLHRAYWGQTRGNPEFLYPDTDEGREQVIADYLAIIAEAEEKVEPLFDRLPTTPVRVERVPIAQENTAPGGYYQPPAVDGSTPGTFFANLRNQTFRPGMRTLAYHEAVPGHHFHLALQRELTLPTVQNVLVFTAHVEGWALYSEKLAREEGFFPEQHSLLHNLWSELFRAARLVVDTGIHHKRWSRQEALDYYNNNLGTPIPNEIDRYIVWPGQATAYKVGELKILELRQRAKDELGDAFDIKEFHNVMLAHGQMPLSILEEQVNLYIERVKNA